MPEAIQIAPAEQQQQPEASLRDQLVTRLGALAEKVPEHADLIAEISTGAIALADKANMQARDRVDSAVAEYPEEHRRHAMETSSLNRQLQFAPSKHDTIHPLRDEAETLGNKLGISNHDQIFLAKELVDAYVDHGIRAANQARAQAEQVTIASPSVPEEEKIAFADEQEAQLLTQLLPRLQELEETSQMRVASRVGRLVMGRFSRNDKFATQEAKQQDLGHTLKTLQQELERLDREIPDSRLRRDIYERFPDIVPDKPGTETPAQAEFKKISLELRSKLTSEGRLQALEPAARAYKEKLQAKAQARQEARRTGGIFGEAAHVAGKSDAGSDFFSTFARATGGRAPRPQPRAPENNDPLQKEFRDLSDDVGADKAFKKLIRQYHPDLNPGDAATETQFKAISDVYDRYSRAATDEEKDKITKGLRHA